MYIPAELKPWLGAGAILVSSYAFLPYIWSAYKKRVQPHVFSWVIWGMTTTIVFFAALEAGGGIGVWAMCYSGAMAWLIALIAFIRRGDTEITRLDWSFFGAAFLSLPLWYFTDDPLWAVIVLTAVDLLGCGPTIRKVHAAPHGESIQFFALGVLNYILVIAALEAYNLATMLFPISIMCACTAVVAIAIIRRRQVPAPNNI